MKKIFVNKCINFIKGYNPNLNETKIAEVKYGLEGLYMFISKLIIILLISIVLHNTKEVLAFLLFYSLIRLPSFGLHATKSWICLLFSSVIFIGVPLICNSINMSVPLKLFLGLLAIMLIFKNSPADTKKKPIVSQKRREVYKFISTIVAIIFVFVSITINNNFISNLLIFVLIVQNIMISPLFYKLFNIPYDNYKTYLLNLNT